MQADGRPFDLTTGGMPSSLCKREIIGHHQDVIVADLQRELRNLRDRSKESLAKSIAEIERLTQENSALKEKNAQLQDKVDSMPKHNEQARRFSLFSTVSQNDLNKSEWANRLESLEREKDREIGMLNCKLRGRDNAIENLEQMVEQQAQSIRSLQSTLDEVQPKVNELEAANVDKALIIEQQNTKVRDHSVTISTLIQTVKSQNQAMANLRSENERMKSEAVGSNREQKKLDASCEKVLLCNVEKVAVPQRRRKSNSSHGTASSSSSMFSDGSGSVTISERAASMTISEKTSSIAPSERVVSLSSPTA